MASCFMICLELSAVCIWTECVFYSETENYPLWYYWETALCKLAFCAAMRQMCYVVKNVLIFKIADSCFGLLSGSLIYSGFIFLSWALLLAVVGLFHCVATVRVENLHSVPYWPVYRHTVLSNSWYDAVCLRGRENTVHRMCVISIQCSVCVCFVCTLTFYQASSQSVSTHCRIM